MSAVIPTGSLAANSAWYAVYTRHQHEKAVAQALAAKSFEVFLPLYSVIHYWKDRTKQLSLPLFPCYVFIRGGIDRRLEVITTPGINSFVGMGGRPVPIPDADIAAIQRTVTSLARVEPHPFLKCDDWVRVKHGPLEGIEGILVRKKNRLRLILSVELLHQAIAVEVDASLVERAPRANARRVITWERRYAPAFA